MRHVSHTHRLAFDWLFDRINLDPKNPNGSRIKVSDELLCLIITSLSRVQSERLWSQVDKEVHAVCNDRGDPRPSRMHTQEAMINVHARVMERNLS